MTVLIVMLAAGIVSGVGTGFVYRYAIARAVIDLPNARSSHSVPTPRGGGIAILAGFLVGVAIVAVRAPLGWPFWLAVAGVLPTTIIGWIDDRHSLPARVRILAHLATAFAITPLALMATPSTSVAHAVLLVLWWAFVVVGSINVTNFVDGIDGMIALQTCIFGIHAALLSADNSSVGLNIALAAAAVGFLFWNWPPARIFMGDVGSGTIGALWVVCGLLAIRSGGNFVFAVFLPLAPVILDAALTIAGRMARRERIWESHRQHLYQRLANGGWGHAKVTLLYGVAAVIGLLITHVGTADMRLIAGAAYIAGVVVVGALMNRVAAPAVS
jgi:Fuc2NAc and GlcNAc transferase